MFPEFQNFEKPKLQIGLVLSEESLYQQNFGQVLEQLKTAAITRLEFNLASTKSPKVR